MITRRTRFSLAQLLDQQPPAGAALLLHKHGLASGPIREFALDELLAALHASDDTQLAQLLTEVLATPHDLRAQLHPAQRFDERLRDLLQCLSLDGYTVSDGRLARTDPALGDGPLIEDELSAVLRRLNTPHTADVLQMLSDSADGFRGERPDYRGALVNARAALETLASDLAALVALEVKATWHKKDWPDVLRYLRARQEISLDEELGLAGLFRLLSPTAHGRSGISEQQLARLGRSLTLNIAWFLTHNHLARRQPTPSADGAAAVAPAPLTA